MGGLWRAIRVPNMGPRGGRDRLGIDTGRDLGFGEVDLELVEIRLFDDELIGELLGPFGAGRGRF